MDNFTKWKHLSNGKCKISLIQKVSIDLKILSGNVGLGQVAFLSLARYLLLSLGQINLFRLGKVGYFLFAWWKMLHGKVFQIENVRGNFFAAFRKIENSSDRKFRQVWNEQYLHTKNVEKFPEENFMPQKILPNRKFRIYYYVKWNKSANQKMTNFVKWKFHVMEIFVKWKIWSNGKLCEASSNVKCCQMKFTSNRNFVNIKTAVK